jgi:hypothetical protein
VAVTSISSSAALTSVFIHLPRFSTRKTDSS